MSGPTELQAWVVAGGAVATAFATALRVVFDWRRDIRERERARREALWYEGQERG